jgi:hypothetical protein
MDKAWHKAHNRYKRIAARLRKQHQNDQEPDFDIEDALEDLASDCYDQYIDDTGSDYEVD